MGRYTEAALLKEAAIRKAHALMTDEEALLFKAALLPWRAGCEYAEGDRFTHMGEYYKVLQAHTSQAEWLPSDAPSLYVRISDPAEEWPEWRQPLGSEDAYPNGAKVTYDGRKWISIVDNNTWQPTVFGWEEYLDG